MCSAMDLDKSGTITFEEFQRCMGDSTLVAYMVAPGLRITDVETFFRVVAGGLDEEIGVEAFVDGCMSMKGMATALDLHKEHWLITKFSARVELFRTCLQARSRRSQGIM